MSNFVTPALGLILAAFVLLQQIAFWQRKEYRLDRARAELVSLCQRPTLIGAILGLVILGLVWRPFIWFSLTALTAFYVHQTVTRGVFKPRPTAKAALTVLITIVLAALAGAIFLRSGTDVYTSPRAWLVIIALVPPLAAIAVMLSNYLTRIQKSRIEKRASVYRRQLPRLQVIGITGSYGKTSTKYFLHHLLATNSPDEIVMSAAHRNEAFVIAQDVLQNVTASTRIYIAEMGAYRSGEIRQTAQLTQPHIGVVTAIRNQHLALFGSLQQLADAKWELIESLPADGIAVLNADDKTIQQQAGRFKGTTLWYSLRQPADIYVEDIEIRPTTIIATIHIKTERKRLTLPLVGEGYLSSALAAAATASAAGMSSARIFERLPTLKPIPQTMVVQTNSAGATIIDDSYSANEDGVLMAVQHLTRFPHTHRVVVLRPLIELGTDTKRAHENIGAALAKADAEVFLFDVAGAEDIEQAAINAGLSRPIHRSRTPHALAETLKKNLTNQTVCLLENRLPNVVRQTALA